MKKRVETNIYKDKAIANRIAGVMDAIDGVQEQVDGKIQTFYQSANPATNWSEEEKAHHIGDLWYRTTDNATMRWNGTSWETQSVSDEVFDTIDGKSQIFISQPAPPYQVGDVWFQGADKDILTCTNDRESGSFVASDWVKLNKYTDDTAVDELAVVVAQSAKEADVEYYNSTSPTSLSGGSWSTTAPTWQDGKYIWTRTKWTQNDGSITYSNPSCITGNTGSKGDKGDKGVGISTIVEYYALNNSTTPPADSDFSVGVKTPTASNKYLWNYELITYSDSTTLKTDKHIAAMYGEVGADGKGISSITDYYAINNSTTAPADSAFSTAVKTPTASNRYLWNYEVTTYTDSTTTKTAKRVIGVYGEKGDAGKGITSIAEYYAINNSTTAPADSEFSTGVKTPTTSNRYLWNYELITYTDSTTTKTEKHVAAVYGQTGTKGNDGKGITSIVDYYALSTTTTAPADSSFSTTVKTVTATNKYLWNYEKTTYTDSTTSNTSKRIIGVYGETGATGKGITSVTELYYCSNSSSTPSKPTAHVTTNSKTTYNAWNIACATWTSTYRYYYTCAEILYTDGTYGWSTISANQGYTSANDTANTAKTTANTAQSTANTAKNTADAAQSTANNAQSTANAAQSTANSAQSAASAAQSTANTANANATTALDRATKKYVTCSTAASTVAKVGVCSGFELFTGAQIVVKFANQNTAEAPTLNVNNTGAKTIRAKNADIPKNSPFSWKANAFVEFIYDGTYWQMVNTNAQDFVGYYDQYLDQTAVFNKLTQNGTKQGIFIDENGDLFVNMTYLQGGIAKLGGANNKDGAMEVYNSGGTRIVRADNTGLYIGNIATGVTEAKIKLLDDGGSITGIALNGANIKAGGSASGSTGKDGTIEVYNSSNARTALWDKTGLYIGNVASSTASPNFKVDTTGAVTVNSLTATGGSISGASIKAGGSATGSTGRDGTFEVYNSSNTRIALWDKTGFYIGNVASDTANANFKVTTTGAVTVNSLTAKGGSITGTTISGNAIIGGTITGSAISGNTIKLGGKTGDSTGQGGVLQVYSSAGTLIGSWNNSGIQVSNGTISGTTISGSTLISTGSTTGTVTIQNGEVKSVDGSRTASLSSGEVKVATSSYEAALFETGLILDNAGYLTNASGPRVVSYGAKTNTWQYNQTTGAIVVSNYYPGSVAYAGGTISPIIYKNISVSYTVGSGSETATWYTMTHTTNKVIDAWCTAKLSSSASSKNKSVTLPLPDTLTGAPYVEATPILPSGTNLSTPLKIMSRSATEITAAYNLENATSSNYSVVFHILGTRSSIY